MIEEISLQEPYSGRIYNNQLDDYKINLQNFKSNLKDFVEKVEQGEIVYVKIIRPSDYKDSIAKVSIKGEIYDSVIGSYHDRETYHRGTKEKFFRPCLTWDGIKNKIHPYLGDLVWMKGYEGPTILKKFDTKAAKKELLNNYKFKDLDGTVLKVGDEVLYINARYGGGMQLNYGIVDRFEASVGADRQEVFTIVKNLTGEESKISNSEAFIKKMK